MIIIDGLSQKCLRRHYYNLQFFKNKDTGSRDHILALENSIRLDCQALGLERRAKEIMNLNEYMKEKYGTEKGKDVQKEREGKSNE
jgi:hypothetical protein